MKRFVWGIVIDYWALLLWGANYLVVVKGYDSYAYGRIYSSDSSRKVTYLSLLIADVAIDMQKEKGWTKEDTEEWIRKEKERHHLKKIDEGLVIFPWIYYPRKWKIERIVEQYGKNSRFWPEEIKKEIE